jgi:catechol 2,3-dioxygenase-like lactoylglutathione lyase family enzyme
MPWKPYDGVPGVNHVAYEVDDVDAIRSRMLAAGYSESTPPNNHPYRKRLYFYDPEGNDWEFVQYLSQNPSERNDYTLPDR